MSIRKDVVGPIAAAVVGATGGAAAISASGLSAAGMVGYGAGIGCAAGPVGLVGGALVGVTAYATGVGVVTIVNRFVDGDGPAAAGVRID